MTPSSRSKIQRKGLCNGTVSVNAAFLREIKEDNQRLKELIDELGALTFRREVALNHKDELSSNMSELVDALAMHFALEEAYGYFDNAIEVAIELTQRAEALRSEHEVLYNRAVDLEARLDELSTSHCENSSSSVTETATDELDRWLASYRQFNHDFARHEFAEVKMILSAVTDDTGVGD